MRTDAAAAAILAVAPLAVMRSSLSAASSSSSSASLSGGGTKQIDILQKLDSNLFDKGYARFCGNVRQPVGMKNSIFNQYKNESDGYVVIDDNTYFCPRWWCPVSNVPIKDIKSKQCPNKDEKPVNLYENNRTSMRIPENPKEARLNLKRHKGPCCYLQSQQKVSSAASSAPLVNNNNKNTNSTVDDDSENIYILTNMDITLPNRYSKIPNELALFMKQNTSSAAYSHCNTSMKKTKCIYRKGLSIDSEKRDIVTVISHLLGVTPNVFSNKVLKEMTFNTFISLENGEVCREFMKVYSTINYTVDKDFFKDVHIHDALKQKIYNAFIHFVIYLKSGNVHTPNYLFSLVSVIFEKVLYIWKYKNGQSLISCPLYSTYNDHTLMLSGTNHNGIMVFNNHDVYEPIVLKSKTTELPVFEFNSFPMLQNISTYCHSKQNQELLINLKSVLALNIFNIVVILVNSNCTVNTFIVNMNSKQFYLQLDEQFISSYIPLLMITTKCKNIKLYDDEYASDIKRSYSSDINNRLQQYNMKFIDSLKFQYFNDAVLIFSSKNYKDIVYKNRKLYLDAAKYIYQNAIKIAPLPLDAKWRSTLHENRPRNIDPKILTILLEEQANYKAGSNVKEWYNSVYFRSNLMSEHVEEHDDRLIFSNKVFKTNELPTEIIDPHYKNIDIKVIKPTDDKTVDDKIKFPESIKFVTGKKVDLPSKWRSYGLQYLEYNNYDEKDTVRFLDFVRKISESKNTMKDLVVQRKIVIQKFLGNKDTIALLINYQNYRQVILDTLKIASTTQVQRFIDKIYDNRNTLVDILPTKLPIGNPDIISASQLFDVTFIIIRNRAIHNTLNLTKRGSVSDIIGTCDVYIGTSKDQSKRPLVVLYSNANKLHFVDMYKYQTNAPKNILEIIDIKLNTK